MTGLMKTLVSFLCAVLVSIGASFAESGDWQVVETNGTVRTSQAMAGVQLVSTGNILGAGSVLSTGADGRAVLVRGEQQIVVGPNSRMSLPAVQEKGMTKIVQDLGTLLFKVDKKEKQHFQVETPIIAAVVKGTTFTVTAGASGHSVHVAEGAVEVSALNGGASQMVTAGMTAMVSKANPRAIEMSSGGQKSGDASSTERGGNPKGKEASNLVVPSDVGADQLDYSNLSGGLVQSSENASGKARANASMGNDVSSNVRGQGGGAAIVEQVRLNSVGDSDKSNRGVGNAFGSSNNNGNGNANANANAGAGNNNGNGNANANANAGAGNNNGNGNGNANANANAGAGNNNGNGNGNANANANAGAGNNNGNGNANANANAGAGNNNGNAGVNVGVGVGGIDVGVGVGQGGVNVGLGGGNPNN
ncbi:FecR family protein [Hyphococcus flavus]|uniref:FecR family protein n=1 Tax=Hyphococcus flavus TaxID=1866326 RepID=A0AAE9ZDH1_9PROT|nr:FecR family protein [Hyphococcus flavus]WDI33038.1 FecR family protein [Hyphococcus flavus]